MKDPVQAPEPMSERVQLDHIEEELRDFLAADLLDIEADPAFKERLRGELWEIVERKATKWRAARAKESQCKAPDSDGDE
jgi:hypothetical protein